MLAGTALPIVANFVGGSVGLMAPLLSSAVPAKASRQRKALRGSPSCIASVSRAFATANGSAASGDDYQAQTGALTFAPGETSGQRLMYP